MRFIPYLMFQEKALLPRLTCLNIFFLISTNLSKYCYHRVQVLLGLGLIFSNYWCKLQLKKENKVYEIFSYMLLSLCDAIQFVGVMRRKSYLIPRLYFLFPMPWRMMAAYEIFCCLMIDYNYGVWREIGTFMLVLARSHGGYLWLAHVMVQWEFEKASGLLWCMSSFTILVSHMG